MRVSTMNENDGIAAMPYTLFKPNHPKRDPIVMFPRTEIVHYSSNGRTCDLCEAVVCGPDAHPHRKRFSVVMIDCDANATWITTRKPTCDRV